MHTTMSHYFHNKFPLLSVIILYLTGMKFQAYQQKKAQIVYHQGLLLLF